MNHVTRLGLLALSLTAAGAIAAQGAANPPAVVPAQGASASIEFTSVDQNKDGKVSSAEAQSNSDLRSAFAALDADSDSYLSSAEFSKWNKAGKAKDSAPAPGAAVPAAPRSSDSAESSSETK